MNDAIAKQTVRSKLGALPVVDFLYLCYLFAVVLMSTLGYSANDPSYVAVVAVGGVFAMLRFFSLRYDYRYIAIAVALVGLGFIELLISRRFTLLLTLLLLISAKGIDVRMLLATFLAAKLAGLALLLVFAVTGVFEVELYQYYKMASDSYIWRMRINGSGTTALHLSLICCTAIWFFIRNGRVSIIYYVIAVILNLLFYEIAQSTMGILMGMGSLLLFFVCQHLNWARSMLSICAKWIIPLLLLFSFSTALLYGRVDFVSVLDDWFQGRIYYNHFFLTGYSLSPFGHGMLSSEGNFDNSYVFVLVAYGLITFVVLFGAMQAAVCCLSKQDDWVSVAFIAIFLLVALSESFFPSAAVNPSLFMLVDLFRNESEIIGKSRGTDTARNWGRNRAAKTVARIVED